MVYGKRVCVVMPAYNAAATLERTYRDLSRAVVDRVIVVDDASSDSTADLARGLGIENLFLDHKLSEYHTGYRAFRRQVLQELPLEENSDDFLFDNRILLQIIRAGCRVGEISCPTRYFPEASNIGFWRSTRYGIAVMVASFQGWLHRLGLATPKFLDPEGRRLKVQESTDEQQ